jgi:hypothetical protein
MLEMLYSFLMKADEEMKSKRPISSARFASVAGLVALVGSIAVWRIFAAGTPVAFEAESGTVAGPATIASSTGTSGGSYVKFDAPTPTPTPVPTATPSAAGVFTLASIPDTQRDLWTTTNASQNFDGRLKYLANNKAALNLKYVMQVGDLQDTDNLTFSSDPAVNPRYQPGSFFNIDHAQYVWASNSLKTLEIAGVPYALAVGNHDTGAVCGGPACPVVAGQTQSTSIEVRNTSTWNMYYPPSRFPGLTVFEAGKTDNAYRQFTAGGVNFGVLNLELWPRTNVIDWAKTVVAAHPHDNIIITTHSYLNGGGGIEQTNGGYGANSPQYVFDNLVKVYPNIRFVFSGHTGNADYRVDTGTNGNNIYEMLDCYHDTVNNWIRLLTVDTVNNTITTKVYSPINGATRTEAQANVTISGINWVR